MNLERKTVREEYRYVDGPRNLGHHEATIIFVDGRFYECRFTGCCGSYTADDWRFLGMVAETIAELSKEKS